MLQSSDCNVVVCRDLNCKLCSTSSLENVHDQQAYIVYTCESKRCKLCREETDVLLDLFCPFNTVESIAEMTRKLNNIIDSPCSSLNDSYDDSFAMGELQSNVYGLCKSEQPDDAVNFQSLRQDAFEMPPHEVWLTSSGQMKDRPGTDLEVIENLQPVDESLLTDLERELEVDQLEDLPELRNICDLISR